MSYKRALVSLDCEAYTPSCLTELLDIEYPSSCHNSRVSWIDPQSDFGSRYLPVDKGHLFTLKLQKMKGDDQKET